MKIWFLARSFYPYQKTGGGQIRFAQVKYLEKNGWDVHVVMPLYDGSKIKQSYKITQIPISKYLKSMLIFERMGIYEDYLDKWVAVTFDYLKNKIKKQDIVFATSGGELGMIKLGSLLKKEIGCKLAVNFHDPIDYSMVNGLKLDKKFHVSREKQEKKYLKNSDIIITSSLSNQKSLMQKYPEYKDKIFNNYFGYIKEIEIEERDKKDNYINIAYVGNMGCLQRPEILYQAFQKLDNKACVKIYFIGEWQSYKPLKFINNKNVVFINYMPHEKFLNFMMKKIDIGFVSLANDYLGACVPSKIYEYINLSLPIIGALPHGDGMDIINKNNFGISCRYDDIEGVVNAITKYKDIDYFMKIKKNIISNKHKWAMELRMTEIDKMLKGLICEN